MNNNNNNYGGSNMNNSNNNGGGNNGPYGGGSNFDNRGGGNSGNNMNNSNNYDNRGGGNMNNNNYDNRGGNNFDNRGNNMDDDYNRRPDRPLDQMNLTDDEELVGQVEEFCDVNALEPRVRDLLLRSQDGKRILLTQVFNLCYEHINNSIIYCIQFIFLNQFNIFLNVLRNYFVRHFSGKKKSAKFFPLKGTYHRSPYALRYTHRTFFH
jgi:hypothetical protein